MHPGCLTLVDQGGPSLEVAQAHVRLDCTSPLLRCKLLVSVTDERLQSPSVRLAEFESVLGEIHSYIRPE
jgi:hypothetical protein